MGAQQEDSVWIRRFHPAPDSRLRLVCLPHAAPSRYRDENVHRRDDDGIVREMKVLSGTDARVLGNEEILRMAMPAMRGDYKAVTSGGFHIRVFSGGHFFLVNHQAEMTSLVSEALSASRP